MNDWITWITSASTLTALVQIMLVNIVLSGDNAVVIALACRNLPPHQRKIGILLGTAVAIVLRIIFYLAITFLSGVPFLKVVGALLLFWIAIKLVVGEEEGGHEISASEQLWLAVRTVAIADAVMSLDNVLAIVGVAKGDDALAILGLVLSIPLIIVGASLITSLIQRFPVVVWIGAALLGWIAGEMLVDDPVVLRFFSANAPAYVAPYPDDPAGIGLKPVALLHYGAATLGVLFVLVAGFFMARQAGRGAAKTA
ncbi:MAG: Membrane protein TerC, possibly involved in tellurium resistance [uncultured Microvirga sp.]|uniref:Membrane protein TerC, possibly involved in tellurium resistance n=1 Tax=uncultured Microvirga sp. TaxID=412392 RepID=A0A6J4MQ55_9HYPH|nr:MAG: Membrane protein TerC, possibly involved in tellurium resistance [uncultured Microvirga sp.]